MLSKMLPASAVRSLVLRNIRGTACHQSSLAKRAPGMFFGHHSDRFYSSGQSEGDGPVKVYYGTLTPRMKAVKVFSITTSLTGMAAQPIIMEQGSKLGGAPMMYFMCGVVGFFTFVTPVLLHVITKKYVSEIHYDPKTEEYTASTISFFLTRVETKFKLKDIQVPENPGMFATFVVNNKTPLFVDAAQFTDPEHYVRMMGYDKPLDLKLNLEEDNTPSSEKAKEKSS